MKSIISLVFLITRQIYADSFTDAGNCTFKDEKSNEFNLSSLKKSEFWKVKDNTSG
jgi:hypothetical protein